ncbi:Bug family tripartite tricarboxylate transporter substrate binding protein [Pseudorhodoferax sp.]|uniref:Bug family tripartite tricarboxylate transporter substrate binding protein n=1 Tax=Pseudorhodoferax sp. TaxID=1993553 RepID=UPI002DD6ABDD|nr:tripartite tricarboxylate transporter substrate binding protein [Pseudorhodoferax sp.]
MHKIRSFLRRRMLGATAAWSAAAMAGFLPAAALAQAAFPSQTIRFVVPFPPGSGTDSTARVFAKALQEITGQAAIVENKPGANGVIAVQAALAAPADGHTIFFGSNTTFTTNAALVRKLPYNPLKDFAALAGTSRSSMLIIVPAASPYRTVAELVADARKRPGALNYGAGSISYTLYTEWLNDLAQMKTTNIAFKGAGEAIVAAAAGQIDFAVVDSTGAIELVKGGRIRALAYTGETRSALLPQVPTIAEAGLPEFLANAWVGAAVSSRTPEPVVRTLEALFQQAGERKDVNDYFARVGMARWMGGPQQMRAFQREEIERWKRIAALAGIERE